MAAIDKIYLTKYQDYVEFSDWCRQQPPLKDKYGRDAYLYEYLYYYDDKTDFSDGCPVMMAPYYIDAYVIRNCPMKAVQDELRVNYGDSYEDIKAGKMYVSPVTSYKYEVGRHFKCVRRPFAMFNTAFNCRYWFVSVDVPDGLPFVWAHKTGKNVIKWDFMDEFVVSDGSSSHAIKYKTIRAIKRMIRKWALPVGSRVLCTGRYTMDEYVFEVTK